MRRASAPLLALSSLALLAQQPAPAPAPATKPAFEMPKPGLEMERLKPLMGSFRVDEHQEAGFMGPAGVSAGYNHVSSGPGGFSLLVDYTTLSGPMHGLKGHGVLGWDAAAKAYKQVWTDSMGPAIMMSTGNWEGDALILNSEGTMMGKPYKEKDTFAGFNPDGFTLTIEMSMDGGPFQKAMTLIHHRIAPAVAPAPAAK